MSAGAPGAARAQEGPGRWTVGLDALFFADTDNVVVATPQVSVRGALDDDGSELRARLGIDVVSAASVDVVSQATRGFHEPRAEASLGLTYAVSAVRPSFDYRLSVEPDYLSNGARVGLAADLGSPDTVLSAGYGATYDRVGRRETPFEVWSRSLWIHRADASLTQTLGQRTVLRGVYSLTVQSGYLEKPYRYVPLFSADSIARARADGVELGLDTFDAYREPGRVPESVPDRRVGHALGARLVQHLAALEAALRVDVQVYLDSWGVAALTTQPTLTFEVGEHLSLAPFVRLYLQSGASFWRRVYVTEAAGALPRWRTLSRELSPYVTATGGARAEWRAEPIVLYVEGSVAYTAFHDSLFLDDRTALSAMAGLRWSP